MHLSGVKCAQYRMKPSSADPIDIALNEDVGSGDITSDFFVSKNSRTTARIVARERAILAGAQTAADVFGRLDPDLKLRPCRKDGDELNAGDTVLEIEGATRSILRGERVALNFLQRLSGIATMTRKFVDAAANEHVKILDTRKTTPGLRALEKAAVVAGGGVNHRFGLFDMVLIKDNHLATLGGLSSFADCIRRVRKAHPNIRIEVEAEDLEQARAFLEIEGIDVILLDNMTPAQMREVVALRRN